MKDNSKIAGNIHLIESFGAFDGPGLRYVLFLQGCPFQCQFCHNRDSWSTKENRLMTPAEVLLDYDKYKKFYKVGGITVSGGEPLMQIDFLIDLFKQAKEKSIHTTLDTSAACYNVKSNEKYNELMKYTDLILLDLKQIDNAAHKILVGSSNKHVLEFATYLSDLDKDTIIRHVTIPKVNDDEKYLVPLRQFIDTLHNIVGIDVLPYHTSGIRKWEEMGLEYKLKGVSEPSKEEIARVEKILKENYQYKKLTK